MSSCGRPKEDDGRYALPVFKHEYEADFDWVTDTLGEFGHIEALIPYRENLLMVAHSYRSNETYLHVIDKKTGTIIQDAVQYGRGPGEAVSTPTVCILGDVLYLDDRMALSSLRYDLSGLPDSTVRYLGKEDIAGHPTKTVYGSDRQLILTNASYLEDSQASIWDRITLQTGKEEWTYNEYPVEDRKLTWFMYNEPRVVVSPDWTRLAIAPVYGSLLEIFDIKGGITPIRTRRFIPADFEVKRANIELTSKTSYGLKSLVSTKTRIYACMVEGKYPFKVLMERKMPLFPMLVIFDWEGNPQTSIKTLWDIYCIAYDEKEDAVYAMLRGPEQSFCLGRMDMSRFK